MLLVMPGHAVGIVEACPDARRACPMQGHSAALQQHLQQQPMLTLNMGPHMAAQLAQLPTSQPQTAEVRLPVQDWASMQSLCLLHSRTRPGLKDVSEGV